MPGILLRVERQRRLVLGEPVPICVLGLFFMQMAAVGKQNIAEVAGRMRAVNPAIETVFGEQRQITAVIDMCMGKDYRVDRSRIDGQWLPVSQAQLFVALEQPAIDKVPVGSAAQEVFRTGYGSRSSKKADFQIRILQMTW